MGAPSPTDRRALGVELGLVLALGLGQSAVYSLVSIVDRLTRSVGLAQQQAQLNPTVNPRPWLDVTYQTLGIFFDLVVALLAGYLLWRQAAGPVFQRLGVSFQGRDVLAGLGLAGLIGIPGLGLYLVGRLLGLTVALATAPTHPAWYTVVLLVLSAARAAVLEEFVGVGYVYARLRALGWAPWLMVMATALLRGTYHLYQGFGPFFGNAVMGVVFGLAYLRWGRLTPLLVAHFMIDLVAFIGYPIALGVAPGLFG